MLILLNVWYVWYVFDTFIDFNRRKERNEYAKEWWENNWKSATRSVKMTRIGGAMLYAPCLYPGKSFAVALAVLAFLILTIRIT